MEVIENTSKNDGNSHQNDLKAGVVIPCYAEGINVIDCLHSLASQEGVDMDEFAVFVVVNNSRNATEDVLASNRNTVGLIKSIWGNVPYITLDELSKHKDIVKSKIDIVLVDLWSQDNAPEVCNVGVARDAGNRVAIKHLNDNEGVIINSDADTVFSKQYLSAALTNFESDPSLIYATGPIQFDRDPNLSPELKRANLLFCISWRMRRIWELLADIQNGMNYDYNSRVQCIAGANFAYRASAYEAVGGFPHTTGAEDTSLQLKFTKAYGTDSFVYDDNMAVKTAIRFSDRTNGTQSNAGALMRLSSYDGNVSDFKVSSFDSILARRKMMNIVIELNGISDDAEWKNQMKQKLQEIFGWSTKSAKLKKLLSTVRSQTDENGEINSADIEINKQINRFLLSKTPQLPLVDALNTALEALNDVYQDNDFDNWNCPFRKQRNEFVCQIIDILKSGIEKCRKNNNAEATDKYVEMLFLIIKKILDHVAIKSEIIDKNKWLGRAVSFNSTIDGARRSIESIFDLVEMISLSQLFESAPDLVKMEYLNNESQLASNFDQLIRDPKSSKPMLSSMMSDTYRILDEELTVGRDVILPSVKNAFQKLSKFAFGE